MSRHILHVFPSFGFGGAQLRLAAVIKGLGPRFRHTIIAVDGSYKAAEILSPGIDVTLGEGTFGTEAFLPRLRRYRRTIAALSPDILVTHNWGSIEWVFANQIGGVPHIHIEDGFGPEESVRQLPRRVWTRRLALRRSIVVVPSLTLQGIATDVWHLPSARVRYIPNGIAPRDGFETSLESLGIGRDRPRIVWAGALRREKNPLRLLRAFAQVKNDAVLLLLGDGPEREAIEREAERLALGSRLHLLGNRPDARDIIMQCDLLALSSDTEQMPLVVLEAMDAGLAVAATDVGDLRQMLAPENRPFVVAGTDEALAQSMDDLLADQNLRQAIGLANRRRAREIYHLDDMVRAYEGIFDRLASAGERDAGV
jgi:glycosyltransferase involved in cell wall biosynthesis